jgi:ABC-type bacteriocin/lantibiotic exporter with double-glycine peptidase domain
MMARVRPERILVQLPLVQSRDGVSCGAAVLTSILSFYNVDHRGLERVRKACRTGKHGTTPKALVQAAQKAGMTVRLREPAVAEDVLTQLDLRRPSVLLIQQDGVGHYVVAVGYDANRLLVMDPSVDGHYGFIPFNELNDRWWDEGYIRWCAAVYRPRAAATRKAVPA